MATVNDYVLEQVILDVTVSSLAPGATIESPKTGSRTVGGSVIGITPNTVTSTTLPRTQRADALHVYCIPPVNADGTAPDFEFYFKVDDQSLENYQLFDGSLDGLMAPLPNVTAGGPIDRDGKFVGGFTLGKSIRAILSDSVTGKPTNNMPLVVTGYKIEESITVVVRSSSGFSNPLVPARIIVTGEILDEEIIAAIAAGYRNFVNKQFVQRQIQGKPPLVFNHGGNASFADWGTLPGGVKQRGTRVHRFVRYAKNATATGTQEAFPLTAIPELKGSENNVVDSNHDLGFNTAKTGNAFWLQGFGCRPGANQAFIGWQIDGNLIPNPYGFPINRRVNPYNFGSVQPQRPESNLFNVIPRYQGELLIYGEGAVPFIKANGTAIAANDAEVVVDGVLVEKVS